MNRKMFLAACVAALALPTAALALPGTAVAAGTTVSVRVEGKSRTLLPSTRAQTHGGWITRYGAPKGQCPATSAQGALDVATQHQWKGIWTTQFGPEYEITSIFGETYNSFKPGSRYFWEIFVNNVAATAGACQIALHRGEQLLFAVAPATAAQVFPLKVTAPRTATVGHPFTAKVVAFDAKGKPHPLKGATVDGKRTGAGGTVRIDPTKSGSLTMHASKHGYIRDELTVHVA